MLYVKDLFVSSVSRRLFYSVGLIYHLFVDDTVLSRLGPVHMLRNNFLSVSRPPPFRNQIRHWIEQKLH